jgi:long-chain acyl-CoA synthetase
MNIFQAFQETCRKYPDKVCIKFKKQESYEGLTYTQLYKQVFSIRCQLIRAGIRPGQRVALLLSNGPHWPAAFFAAMSIQAVVVPIDVQLAPEEIHDILVHSASRILLTEDKFGIALGGVLTWDMAVKILFVDREEDFVKDIGQEDMGRLSSFGPHKLAALFYTSGTTKERKAVMLTHHNLLSNVESIDKLAILKEDDIIMSLLPLHHTYPFMITCLVPFVKGLSVCYFQSMVHYELFNAIRENKVSIFVGVPQLFSLIERSVSDRIKKYGFFVKLSTNALVDVCRGLSTLTGRNVCKKVLKGMHAALGEDLRLMTSGGAKLDSEVARNFSRWGFKVIEGYGLTETSPVATFTSLNRTRFTSVGKPVPGVETKIMYPNGEGIGEVAIRGANVMLGYYRALAITRQVIKDGWFFTGDIGFIDKDGLLHLTGRKDELIVLASGKKINPEDIEGHYLKSPYIKEMCVLFEKTAVDAGHLTAVIVPDEDYLKAHKHVNINFKIKWELDAYSQKLPLYQRIKGFVLTSEALPRTRLGKLIRYKAQLRYVAGGIGREEKKVSPQGLSRFEELALGYLSKILKKDVSLDDHLELDLGLDSLGRIELLSALQDLVNVGIDDSLALELFQSRTIRDLITKARQALPDSAFLGFVKTEETVFWPHVLQELPSAENIKKLKLNFSFFERAVTFIEVLFFKLFFRSVFLVSIEGRENIPKDGPFVIAPNHVSFLDAFYVLCALPLGLILRTYFVGFGAIFNHPLIAWGAKFHRLVPIDADLNLGETLKMCSYILREGKVLVYFPEGQRSIDGNLKEFRKGVGILLKETQAKVLPVYISGAYKAWPRTRAFPLPAKITIRIGKCLGTDELKVLPGEDPYVGIANSLKAKVSELVKP